MRSVITARWKWKSKFSLWFSLTSWKGGPVTSWWGWKSQLPTHTLWHFPGRRWCGVGYLVTAWSGWNSALILSFLTMWVGEWSTDFSVVLTCSFLSCYFPPLLVFCLEITSFSRLFFPVSIVVGFSNTQARIYETQQKSVQRIHLCVIPLDPKFLAGLPSSLYLIVFLFYRKFPGFLDTFSGLSRWCSHKESSCHCRRCRSDPWVGKFPWSRKWQPTPVFLPGKFHGQRSLVGYSPWGHKQLDMTQWLSTSTSGQNKENYVYPILLEVRIP